MQITSGSYILREVDSDGEHLYSYTIGSAPVKLATYAEIANLTGGITGIKTSDNTNLQPVNGVITLPSYVKSSDLSDYVTMEDFGPYAGGITGLNFEISRASNHGKAIAIAKGDVVVESISESTYVPNSYVESDAFCLIMSTEGQLLLEVVSGNTTTYYKNWSVYHNTRTSTKPELVPSSECKTWDLYFLKNGTDLIFWTWSETEEKFV